MRKTALETVYELAQKDPEGCIHRIRLRPRYLEEFQTGLPREILHGRRE